MSGEQRRGRRLGILFTVGDLASAIGPPLAYALILLIGLSVLYLFRAAEPWPLCWWWLYGGV